MSENQPYEPDQPAQEPVQPPPVQPPPAQPATWQEERQQAREQRREQRQEWREQRREERRQRGTGGAWIWGVFLIVLGLLFLLSNYNLVPLTNWWALFIMLPAIGSFQSAFYSYRAAGNRLSASARGGLIGGVILTAVSLVLLFGVGFGILWAVILILGGGLMLLNALLPS